MKPNIRPMTSKDKPALMRILRVVPEFQSADLIVAEEVLDSFLHDPPNSGYHVLVAELGSAVAGYICYGPTPLTQGTWDIYWMAVAPETQGQGIGRALLAFAECKIRESRGRLTLIETSSKPEYERTRHFHYLQGYELICSIADFYAPGEDKIILGKRFNH